MIRTDGPRPRHFLQADFEPLDVTPDADIEPSWTSRSYRLRNRQEIQLTDRGQFIVPSGNAFLLAVSGTLVAPDLQPVDPWLVQIYLINQLTKDAIGTLQLTRLGDFQKLLPLVGPAYVRWHVYTTQGKVHRLTLPNRNFQAGDLRIDNLQIDARNVSIPENQEVRTTPKAEARAPQVQPGGPGGVP